MAVDDKQEGKVDEVVNELQEIVDRRTDELEGTTKDIVLVKDAFDAEGEQVREIIGRYTLGEGQLNLFRSRVSVKTWDETIPHYRFFDELRRGKAFGYALGSLFAKRLENIFAGWIMGDGVMVELEEKGDEDNENDPRTYTNKEISEFLKDQRTTFLTLERDKFGLGDQFVIVNPDGSISVPSPDTVEEIRNPIDYRDIEEVIIETRLEQVTIRDSYTAIGRTLTHNYPDGSQTVEEFENLIGVLPIVHIAHARSANETHGHSIHEQLVPLYDQYDDVAFKQLDGVKLLGNPMLAFMGMEDITQVFNLNEPSTTTTYIDKDGNQVDRQELNVDENAILVIGKGGTAQFVAPPTGFTADTQQALKTLFLLLLDHTGIPEVVWGNEMSAGRSSSETQMVQFTKDIENLRTYDEVWVRQIVELFVAFRALVDPQMVVDTLVAKWSELMQKDVALLLEQLKFAAENGILTKQMMLTLLALVDDPADQVEQAQEEADERREKEFPEGDNAQFQDRLTTDNQGETADEQV